MHIFESKKSEVVLVVFSYFPHNVVVLPFHYKKPLFHLKKVACERFEIAILVSKLRQIRPFLSYCGAFMERSCLNGSPRCLFIMRKCPAILPDAYLHQSKMILKIHKYRQKSAI